MSSSKPPSARTHLTPAEYERQISAAEGSDYVLHLYVAGTGPLSTQAIENLNRLCRNHLEGHYQLKVIDIHQQPEAVAEAQLVAAPTLVKMHPPPRRKFIGNLGRSDRILRGITQPARQ